jgi:hypothetical protein
MYGGGRLLRGHGANIPLDLNCFPRRDLLVYGDYKPNPGHRIYAPRMQLVLRRRDVAEEGARRAFSDAK